MPKKINDRAPLRKSQPTNPPKTKVIARVGRQVDYPAQRKALAVLAPSVFGVLSLLQLMPVGERVTTQAIGRELGRTASTVYRAIASLKTKDYLAELDGVWTVRWTPEGGDQ